MEEIADPNALKLIHRLKRDYVSNTTLQKRPGPVYSNTDKADTFMNSLECKSSIETAHEYFDWHNHVVASTRVLQPHQLKLTNVDDARKHFIGLKTKNLLDKTA